MLKIEITEEEYKEIKNLEKETQNKKLSRRLKVLMLRYEGLTIKQISEKLDISESTVSKTCVCYRDQGLKEFARNKYTSHSWALSFEEEEEILQKFADKAEKGQQITVAEIKAEFDRIRGKDTGRGYIYEVLKRHGWRKVMPRSKHPKAADEEACGASKKLTPAPKWSWQNLTQTAK